MVSLPCLQPPSALLSARSSWPSWAESIFSLVLGFWQSLASGVFTHVLSSGGRRRVRPGRLPATDCRISVLLLRGFASYSNSPVSAPVSASWPCPSGPGWEWRSGALSCRPCWLRRRKLLYESLRKYFILVGPLSPAGALSDTSTLTFEGCFLTGWKWPKSPQLSSLKEWRGIIEEVTNCKFLESTYNVSVCVCVREREREEERERAQLNYDHEIRNSILFLPIENAWYTEITQWMYV